MTASNCCGVSATSALAGIRMIGLRCPTTVGTSTSAERHRRTARSEEHTSELQSRSDLVCRLLLEKKKKHDSADAEWANNVVTMGCGDTSPVIPGKRYVDLELHDPAGQDVSTVTENRDQHERRVAG